MHMMAPIFTGVGTKTMANMPQAAVGMQTKTTYDNIFNPAPAMPVAAATAVPIAPITQQAQVKQDQEKAAAAQGGASQNLNAIQQIDS